MPRPHNSARRYTDLEGKLSQALEDVASLLADKATEGTISAAEIGQLRGIAADLRLNKMWADLAIEEIESNNSKKEKLIMPSRSDILDFESKRQASLGQG